MYELIFTAAEAIGSKVRTGRRWPTLWGAIFGAGTLGVGGHQVASELTIPGALIGGLGGAIVAAHIFKRPPAELGLRASEDIPFRPGKIVRYWTYEMAGYEFKSMTVLLENALYVVRDDKAPWAEIHAQLEQGRDPDRFLGELIRLKELTGIQLKKLDATEVEFIHRVASQSKGRATDFQTTMDRDEMIASVERVLGKPFGREKRPISFGSAIRTPLILASVVGLLFIGVASLSEYWTTNPPPPPRGKREQDSLVRFLVDVGPNNILLLGALIFLPLLAWTGFRILYPPQVWLLSTSDDTRPTNDSV
jgi:hypothetical protein